MKGRNRNNKVKQRMTKRIEGRKKGGLYITKCRPISPV